MKKSLLLTVSDEMTSSTNIRFIQSFFPELCDFEFTLLYVTPKSSGLVFQGEALTPDAASQRKIEDMKKARGRKTLDEVKKELIRLGCSDDMVVTRLSQSSRGTVAEIVDEGHKGMFDAVVLGRRGASWFDELMEDSVNHKLLWQEIDFPVWSIRQRVPPERQGILLCTDGSAPSLRMVDHVGFMLASAPEQPVTLFRVETGDNGSDEAFPQARELLREHGVDDRLITEKTVRSGDAAGAILHEANTGRYAVVAAGRNRKKQGMLKFIFPGSVSRILMRDLERAALWISR